MERKQFEELITDYITGNCSEQQTQEFELFLKNNPASKLEVEEMKVFLNGFEDEVEASSAMDMKFYAMLNAEEQKKNKVSMLDKLVSLLQTKFTKQLVYTFAILTVGFFVGNTFNFKEDTNTQSLDTAKNETENVRSQLVLTLLDQPSANKRLQAVNEVNKLNSVTKTITRALFSTLNSDTNVNVRLSAIEALANYTEISEVREGLIASIIHQKSPMVQIALADLMVKLQEKKAVKSFKKLINEKDVNESAKLKMEESIQQII
jgi:hypothetical protein